MSTRLDNEFTVPVPVTRAWEALLDVERVAPCMPGATLDSVEGDTVTGRVKVKVGPITVTYRGQARFVETNEAERTVTVDASGKEARGTGTASAKVRAELHDEGDATRVRVTTDLNVTGRVAQFGRGVIADVSAKLVARFAENLAAELQRDTAAEPAAAREEGGPAVVSAEPRTEPGIAPEPEPAVPAEPVPGGTGAVGNGRRSEDTAIDLLDIAGGPVVKRAAIAVGGAIVGLVLLRWLRGRRGRK